MTYGKVNEKKGSSTSHFGTVSRINHNSTSYYNSKLYKELETPNKLKDINNNEFPKELENTIINSTSESMGDIPDNSVHLMITFPPI